MPNVTKVENNADCFNAESKLNAWEKYLRRSMCDRPALTKCVEVLAAFGSADTRVRPLSGSRFACNHLAEGTLSKSTATISLARPWGV